MCYNRLMLLGKCVGEPGGTRTRDPMIKSQGLSLCCQRHGRKTDSRFLKSTLGILRLSGPAVKLSED